MYVYLHSFHPSGRSWKDPVVYPEYLNVLGALLYLWSSALYHKEGGPLDDSTHHVSR